MINLHFEPYCQNCREIEVKQATEELTFCDKVIVDTVLYCAHRNRCADMLEHLKEVNRDSCPNENNGS